MSNREFSPLDVKKLRLVAEPHKNASVDFKGNPKQPEFAIGLHENQPHFVVTTNVETDTKNYGKIKAELDTFNFNAIMEAILEAASGNPNFTEVRVTCRGYVWTSKGRSDKPLVKATVIVGRNDKGEVWIAVLDYDQARPSIQFVFRGNEWHDYLNADGTPIDAARQSRFIARGYVDIMRRFVAARLDKEAIHWEDAKAARESKKNGGGGNNSYNSGGNRNQSNHQKPQQKPVVNNPFADETYDDDILFN